MPVTIHVIARVRAKEGKEDPLKVVLVSLVAPSRRELACHQYDLLQNTTDKRDFCFIERWSSEQGLDQHAASAHVTRARQQMADLVEAPPDIRRYHQL